MEYINNLFSNLFSYSFWLENKYALTLLSFILVLIFTIFFLGISICKLAKNVHIFKVIILVICFVMICYQLNIFYDIKKTDSINQFWLLMLGMLNPISLAMLFITRKNIRNEDFIACIAILILMQSTLSMLISNSTDVSLNVKFLHGCFYIGLPAFLIYEISNNEDKFKNIEDKLKSINTGIKNMKDISKKNKSACCLNITRFFSKK